MSPPTLDERRDRLRQLLFFREPRLWPRWPFLPVVRRTDGVLQFGLLFDTAEEVHAAGWRVD
jgi:hypothetical protein